MRDGPLKARLPNGITLICAATYTIARQAPLHSLFASLHSGAVWETRSCTFSTSSNSTKLAGRRRTASVRRPPSPYPFDPANACSGFQPTTGTQNRVFVHWDCSCKLTPHHSVCAFCKTLVEPASCSDLPSAWQLTRRRSDELAAGVALHELAAVDARDGFGCAAKLLRHHLSDQPGK